MPRSADRARPRRRMGLAVAAAACVLAGLLATGKAVTQLKRADEAPAFALKDVDGAELKLSNLRGKVVVVLFGELYHDKTRQACALVDKALRDPRLQGQPIVALLIAAEKTDPADLKAVEKLSLTVLRDPQRQAFGAYQVAVMPSAVVVDAQGKVVHALAGLTGNFGDVLADALLLAAGKLTPEAFDRSLSPQPASAPDETLKADRLAQLAKQLARRGMEPLAVEKYREALAADGHHLSARLELGTLLLKQGHLPEAEAQFRSVLADRPGYTPAVLGLAFVQTRRGGSELDPAERSVRDVLAREPSSARACYLLGLIQEQRGKIDAAAASYKQAAQLLLEQMGE